MTEQLEQTRGETAEKSGKKAGRVRGLGRVYLRGSTWWCQYYHCGRLIRESSGSSKPSVAAKLLKRRLGEIGQGRLIGPEVERTTFADLAQMLFDDYRLNSRKSLDRAQRSVEHLKPVFGLDRAVNITPDRIAAYVASRMRVAKPATIRLELAALKRMFTLGLRAGRVAYKPAFPTLSIQNARTGFFEPRELEAVLTHLSDDLRPLVRFLALTGWRVSEARSLRWSQVDFAGGVVRLEVGTTKSGAGRVFPFAALPALATVIRTQRETTSALEREQGRLIPFVFHRGGEPIRSFHHAWRSACARAGVPGRLVHDLRRTAARELVRSGVPERTAMALLGHKTRSIFDRYNIVNEADLADGVRKLAAFRPEGSGHVRRAVPLVDAEDSE